MLTLQVQPLEIMESPHLLKMLLFLKNVSRTLKEQRIVVVQISPKRFNSDAYCYTVFSPWTVASIFSIVSMVLISLSAPSTSSLMFSRHHLHFGVSPADQKRTYP